MSSANRRLRVRQLVVALLLPSLGLSREMRLRHLGSGRSSPVSRLGLLALAAGLICVSLASAPQLQAAAADGYPATEWNGQITFGPYSGSGQGYPGSVPPYLISTTSGHLEIAGTISGLSKVTWGREYEVDDATWECWTHVWFDHAEANGSGSLTTSSTYQLEAYVYPDGSGYWFAAVGSEMFFVNGTEHRPSNISCGGSEPGGDYPLPPDTHVSPSVDQQIILGSIDPAAKVLKGDKSVPVTDVMRASPHYGPWPLEGKLSWLLCSNDLPDSDGDGISDPCDNEAKIIVEKKTVPTGATQTFSFSGALNGSISDGQRLEQAVEPGTYSVVEDDAPGSVLTGITCADGNSSGDIETRTATFHVEENETVKCTFENTLGPCADPATDPVFCYAPEVRLHPDEDSFPLGTDEFVSHSKLKWAHDSGCFDDVVRETGSINPSQLGQGPDVYSWHQAGNKLCGEEKKEYFANQVTRPGTETKYKAKGMALDEGFFLDLENDWRGGDTPAADGDEINTPVTYNFNPGDGKKKKGFITYWFMYGFNPGAPGPGAIVDRHEGEWERITVVLSPTNHATGVTYFQHLCNGEEVSWATMTDGDPANGEVTQTTHPVVYSANGSHASFKNLVDLGAVGITGCKFKGPINQGLYDVTDDGGHVWPTWKNLRDATKAPWYGYGGAWGEVGANATGPLGPPCYTLAKASPPVDTKACPKSPKK